MHRKDAKGAKELFEDNVFAVMKSCIPYHFDEMP